MVTITFYIFFQVNCPIKMIHYCTFNVSPTGIVLGAVFVIGSQFHYNFSCRNTTGWNQVIMNTHVALIIHLAVPFFKVCQNERIYWMQGGQESTVALKTWHERTLEHSSLILNNPKILSFLYPRLNRTLWLRPRSGRVSTKVKVKGRRHSDIH